MAHVRTVTLRRGNDTMTVKILRSDDNMAYFRQKIAIIAYSAWPTTPGAGRRWIGNSFLELSTQWEKEGWRAVVDPDQQETPTLGEYMMIRENEECELLTLMRDVANLQSRVKILERQGFKRLDRKMRELDNREAKLNERELRGIGEQEIEKQAQKMVDAELFDLFGEYEKVFFNRKKVPISSEPELLQLVLIGRIWKKLSSPHIINQDKTLKE